MEEAIQEPFLWVKTKRAPDFHIEIAGSVCARTVCWLI